MLITWANNTPQLNCQGLVARVKQWQQIGYVTHDVWHRLQKEVDFHIDLPIPTPSQGDIATATQGWFPCSFPTLTNIFVNYFAKLSTNLFHNMNATHENLK